MTMHQATTEEAGTITVPRKLPLAAALTVLGVLAVQTSGAVWWLSKTDSRLATLEQTETTLQSRIDERANANRARIERLEGLSDRVARIEENTRHTAEMIRDMREDVRDALTRSRR